MDIGILKVKSKSFQNDYQNEYNVIKDLIHLRNDIIHLKPIVEDTNTKYKKLFRRVIDFDYDYIAKAVKEYINFYEPGLVEECPCGKEYYFDLRKR